MRPTALRLALVLVAVALAGPAALPAPALAGGCAGASSRPTPARTAEFSSTTLCLLNRERARHGLGRLHSNSALAIAAWRHSRDMAQHNYFAHGDFVGRIRAARYFGSARGWTVGENIAWGSWDYATPASIVDAWMHSPGHRANILNGRFKEIGLGVARGAPARGQDRGGTYVTDFGTRF
jgi:uncharacterized protein YkwD